MHETVQQNVPEPYNGSIHDRLLERRSEFLLYFRRRLARPEDAEDVFQDFCLKALRMTGQLGDESKTDAWLGCVLRTTLIDYYRRRAGRARGEVAYQREPRLLAIEAEPAHHVDVSCHCVRKGLTDLRLDHVEILKRIDLNEEPRTQIAEDLGLTVNNVGVRLHRARQALKAKIKEFCPICGDGRFAECDC